MLWRHIEWRDGSGEVRRSRRLVISSFSAIGNYDYGFFWYLYQDGTIEFEVKLTGVLSTGAVAPGVRPEHGTLVAPGLNAMVHQHFFNMRLDLDVDGQRERRRRGLDGVASARRRQSATATPSGPRRRRLATRARGPAHASTPRSARWWEIVNPSIAPPPRASRSATGWCPARRRSPFAQPDAPVSKRAGFIREHLWVTPYRRDERYAAGEYPNLHPGGAGLPEWTSADRPIDGEDIVVWYTFGHHHVPAARGLAGDAGDDGRVQAEAGRVLRAQPGARRAAVAAAFRPLLLSWEQP